MVSSTIWEAVVRGLSAFGVVFIGAFLLAYTQLPDSLPTGEHWTTAFRVALASGAVATAFRTLFEGLYDAWRQSRNKATPADVNAGVPTILP